MDVDTQLIAAVALVDSGSDMQQMQPMHQAVQQRYGVTPEHWLADGGFTKVDAIEHLHTQGTQAVVPPPRSRNPQIDALAPKNTDSAALAQWRRFMASDEGRALHRRRGASVECANAQLRRRGLTQFNVCGKAKARAVLLWHALAHNLMRMSSLNIAFAGSQRLKTPPGHHRPQLARQALRSGQGQVRAQIRCPRAFRSQILSPRGSGWSGPNASVRAWRRARVAREPRPQRGGGTAGEAPAIVPSCAVHRQSHRADQDARVNSIPRAGTTSRGITTVARHLDVRHPDS